MRDRQGRNRKRTAAESADMRSKITNVLDIPQGAMGGISQMELSGNREAVIDGCMGVLAYDEDVIRLALKGMVCTFRGRNLQIKVLTHDSAIVAGYITNIEFSV
ncbi:MAG: YabP/YqfC family sporulation protein [Oscillospiraceae bacterium]|nr:YabP/YqfC family sporulation protein [Oscillospiraceae bacterium]